MNNIDIYETNLSIESTIVQYLFESKGEKRLLKPFSIRGFKTQTGLIMYNLGFGDYDFETKSISDSQSSNNGDMRTVFNTVFKYSTEFKIITDLDFCFL